MVSTQLWWFTNNTTHRLLLLSVVLFYYIKLTISNSQLHNCQNQLHKYWREIQFSIYKNVAENRHRMSHWASKPSIYLRVCGIFYVNSILASVTRINHCSFLHVDGEILSIWEIH